MENRLILYPKLTGLAMFTLIFILTVFFAYFIYLKGIEAVENEIKSGLLSNVTAAATVIDGDLHKSFDSTTRRDDPVYLNAVAPLEKIRQASKNIRYIYTNILKDNSVYFILNPSPQNDNDGDGEPDIAPALMDPYYDASEALLSALNKEAAWVSKDSYSDEWGTFYSAYAPFYDKDNNFVGTLGMDLDLVGFDKKLEDIRRALKRTAIVIIVVSIFSGTGVWYVLKLAQHLNIKKENQYTKYILNKKELNSSREIIKKIVIDIKTLLYFITTSQKNILLKKDFEQFIKSCEPLFFKINNIMTYYNMRTKVKKNIDKSNITFLNVLNESKMDLLDNDDINMIYSLSEMPSLIYENRDELTTLLRRTAQLITGLSSRDYFNLDITMRDEYINNFSVDLTYSSKNLIIPFDTIHDFTTPYFCKKDIFIGKSGLDNYTIPIIFNSLKSLKGTIKIQKEKNHLFIINITLNKSVDV